MSLECTKNEIIDRKNSFKIFGYDFMVDRQLNVWLIEANCSPSMEYSTIVTEDLVQEVMEDTCKVIVDNKMLKQKGSTGNWVKIHKGKKS